MPHTVDDGVAANIQLDSSNASSKYNGAALFTFNSAMKNIIFGSLAGMVSEVFEYPFDLAKVRLQAQILAPTTSKDHLRFNGPLDCLKQTWRAEGVRGLYRGIEAPLAGAMAETAILFLAYSGFQDAIRGLTSRSRTDKLSIPELGIAAAAAGFMGSFIVTPIELVKCRMQVQMMNVVGPRHKPSYFSPASISPTRLMNFPLLSTNHVPIAKPHPSPNRMIYNSHAHSPATTMRLPPGALGVVRETIQSRGVRGLWTGHTGTLVRETGGTAAWFVIKEIVADTLLRRRAQAGSRGVIGEHTSSLTAVGSTHISMSEKANSGTELLAWESAVSGAVAGALCVLAFYPVDTVKSAMQTEDELRPTRAVVPSKQALVARASSQTFTGTLARVYAASGLRGLYAGCGMTVMRAVPSSGIVFVVYDSLATWLG